MLTKTRTIIITLIAAGSFATATVAPAVSHAQDNSAQNAAECEVLRLTKGLWEQAAENAGRNGQWDLYRYYISEAFATQDAAKDKGCTWAAIQKQPESNRPPVSKVITTTPPVTTPAVKVVKVVRPVASVG